MASLNVGSLSAKFGLDSSAFLDKLRGVSGATALFSNQMKRDMKESSRESVESFRLLDESLNLHISRPLTRILTQEFPSFAKGLQAILGGAVFGALATVGVEAFEKIEKKVEEARKAEEAFAESSRMASEVATTEISRLQNKLAEMGGGEHTMRFGLQGTAEAQKAIDAIAKASDQAAKDAEKIEGFWHKIYIGAGQWGDKVVSVGSAFLGGIRGSGALSGSEGIKQERQNMKDALKDMRVDLEIALNTDAAKGTHNSLVLIQNDIKAAKAYLEDFKKVEDEEGKTRAYEALDFFTNAQAAAQTAYKVGGAAAAEDTAKKAYSYLRQQAALQDELNDAYLTGTERERAHLQVLEQEIGVLQNQLTMLPEQMEKIRELQAEAEKVKLRIAVEQDPTSLSFIRELQSELKGWNDQANKGPKLWQELNEEVDKVTAKAGAGTGSVLDKQLAGLQAQYDAMKNAFTAMGTDVGPGLDALFAEDKTKVQVAAFTEEVAKLQEKLKETTLAAQEFGSGSPFAKVDSETQKLTTDLHLNAEQAQTVRSELMAIQSETDMGKAFEHMDALNAGGGKMQELRQQMDALNRASTTGRTDDGVTLSADALAAVKLEMQAILAEEDQILLKTGGINAGIKAWADGLQRVKSEGEFALDMLDQATKGFEDNAVKSIENILERQGGGNRKLIEELRKQWANYFDSLASMALKHQLDRLLAPLGAKIGNALAPKVDMSGVGMGPSPSQVPLPPPIFGLPHSVTTAFGGLGKDDAELANTTALTANTTALGAATAALGAGAGAGAGIPFLAAFAGAAAGASAGGGGGGAGGLDDSGYAGGTDFARGGPTWVGERGPEILNLPRGSQVTPNDVATRGGGDVHNHNYDFRGAVVTDDLLRKAEGASMLAAGKRQAVNEAIAHISELRRRTLQR